MAATPNTRDWAGIFISILVIGSIIGLVALAVRSATSRNSQKTFPRFRLLPHPVDQQFGESTVSLDQVGGGKFIPNRRNATWVAGMVMVKCINVLLSSVTLYEENNYSLHLLSLFFGNTNHDHPKLARHYCW